MNVPPEAVALIVAFLVPLTAKLISDVIKRGLAHHLSTQPAKIKIKRGHAQIEIALSQDMSKEDVDTILKLLNDIKDSEQAPPTKPV